jgi:hypothetical protein
MATCGKAGLLLLLLQHLRDEHAVAALLPVSVLFMRNLLCDCSGKQIMRTELRYVVEASEPHCCCLQESAYSTSVAVCRSLKDVLCLLEALLCNIASIRSF